MMIILAVIIGFAVGCFFMKQRVEDQAKKKLHTSEQEHEEDEDSVNTAKRS